MDDPTTLVTEYFRRLWHPPYNYDSVDDLMTEDYALASAGARIKGRDAFIAWVKQFHGLLHDATTENVEAFANADGTMVVSRWICTGRNNGIFGLPPNGRPVSYTGISIWRVRDGRLAECWAERSALEVYKELAGRP